MPKIALSNSLRLASSDILEGNCFKISVRAMRLMPSPSSSNSAEDDEKVTSAFSLSKISTFPDPFSEEIEPFSMVVSSIEKYINSAGSFVVSSVIPKVNDPLDSPAGIVISNVSGRV